LKVNLTVEVYVDPVTFLETIAKQNPLLVQTFARGESVASWGPPAFAGCPGVAEPDPIPMWVRNAVHSLEGGLKVEAIKIIRTNTGLGLKEAKDIADRYLNNGQIVYNSYVGSYVPLSEGQMKVVDDLDTVRTEMRRC
jgi:hypothetical protein